MIRALLLISLAFAGLGAANNNSVTSVVTNETTDLEIPELGLEVPVEGAQYYCTTDSDCSSMGPDYVCASHHCLAK